MKKLKKVYWSVRSRIFQRKLERVARDPYWQHKIVVLPPSRGEWK